MLKQSIFCWLNSETFAIYLYNNESLNEYNYIIKGRINFKSKKFELIDINNSAHNNKTNFITASSVIKGNKKPEEYFFISGDHEGVLKIWKIWYKTNKALTNKILQILQIITQL